MMRDFILFILLVKKLLLRTDAIPNRPYFIYKRLHIYRLGFTQLISCLIWVVIIIMHNATTVQIVVVMQPSIPSYGTESTGGLLVAFQQQFVLLCYLIIATTIQIGMSRCYWQYFVNIPTAICCTLLAMGCSLLYQFSRSSSSTYYL